MKHIHILAGAATVFAVALASCTKDAQNIEAPVNETGTVTINVVREAAGQTKTTSVSFMTAMDYEKAVNRQQVLIFNSSGRLEFYADLDTTATSLDAAVSTGEKTVYAVINGPDLSAIKSLDEFQGCALDLSANKKTTSAGFVMSGSATCNVEPSAAVSCEIAVKRLVARIVLFRVANELPSAYGSLSLKAAYLANVVGTQNPAGTMALEDATWYNKYGRSDSATSSGAIIDGTNYRASCSDLTYILFNKTITHGMAYSHLSTQDADLFYTFANSSTTAPKTFSNGTFVPQRTILVLCCELNGESRYYPVVFDQSTLEANNTYMVDVTISGIGSADPAVPVEHGDISATIKVSNWTAGFIYGETI